MTGRKVWTGETLSAAELQGYLQDQVVAEFASAAARTAAWTAPHDGALSYLRDVKRHDEYRGGWVPLLGGARGQVARADLSGGAGPTPQLYQLGQTAAAAVRSGERLEHRVSLQLYATTTQVVVLNVARFNADASTGRVLLGARHVAVGGTAPDDGMPVAFSVEEMPAAGTYVWKVEAGSNVGGTAMAVLPTIANAMIVHTLTTSVVART